MIFYKIRRKINDLFFSMEPGWYWGLFCIFFSIIIIDYTLGKNISLIYHNIYYPLPLFDFFHIPDPNRMTILIGNFFSLDLTFSHLFTFMKIIVSFSLVFCLLGIFQKFFISLSLISFFLFQGWFYGYIRTAEDPYVYHSVNIVCFVFLIWLFAPSCSRWTIFFWLKKLFKRNINNKLIKAEKDYPVWPRLLVILTIAITFFSSFYCKLDTAGFKWINGFTLQGKLLEQYAVHYNLSSYWLAQQNFYLIWLLNIGVWLFQSTAPLGYLLKRTRLLYAVVGTLFHIFIVLFFGFWFVPFQYIYVVFIPEIVDLIQAVYKKRQRKK